MTWERKKDGTWERNCRHCGGRGRETLTRHSSVCQCPTGHTCDTVEHPLNTKVSDLGGIGKKLVRCNSCGTFWVVYYERSDDSWDVPPPDCLGKFPPADDWGKEAKA